MLRIIGIDPGTNGGIALRTESEMKAWPMPETMADIYTLLMEIIYDFSDGDRFVCYMEDVGHGMPGQSSSATAKFARHNGWLDMAIYSLGIPRVMVTPQKWLKAYSNTLGNSKSCANKVEWKNKLKGEAQRRYPKMKVTLKTADAMLIAEYGYRCEM